LFLVFENLNDANVFNGGLNVSNDELNINQDDNLNDSNVFHGGLNVSNDELNINQGKAHHYGKL
jgi:hypothetical protein